MWEVILGTAAAHKAASVGVGLSVLLGTAGTAEMTGIGPTVRELVRHEVVATDTADTDEELDIAETAIVEESDESGDTEGLPEETSAAVESIEHEEEEDADHPQDDREHFVADAEDAPGNLVWHQRNGVFHLRGTLVDDGDGLAIRTAGPDGGTVDLPIDADEVEAHIPGSNGKKNAGDEIGLADLVGSLVRADGVCVEPATDDDPAAGCIVTELHILGNAGQPGGEDDEASLSSDESSVELDEDADEDVDGEADLDGSENEGSDEEKPHGKPDHAGGPKNKD